VFVDLLRWMMRRRPKPLHLLLDGLSAHKTLAVKHYVAELDGKLTVHYLPGYAPDLNPDELVWSYTKRTGHARRPLQDVWPIASRRNSPRWRAPRTRPLHSSGLQVLPIFLPTEYGEEQWRDNNRSCGCRVGSPRCASSAVRVSNGQRANQLTAHQYFS